MKDWHINIYRIALLILVLIAHVVSEGSYTPNKETQSPFTNKYKSLLSWPNFLLQETHNKSHNRVFLIKRTLLCIWFSKDSFLVPYGTIKLTMSRALDFFFKIGGSLITNSPLKN